MFGGAGAVVALLYAVPGSGGPTRPLGAGGRRDRGRDGGGAPSEHAVAAGPWEVLLVGIVLSALGGSVSLDRHTFGAPHADRALLPTSWWCWARR